MSPLFNADRLNLALRRRGMPRRALSERLDVSYRTIARYLKEEVEPDQATVTKFAKVLRFPPEFFHQQSLDEISPSGPSFRAMSTLTVRQRDQAITAGILGVAFSDWIDEHFGLPDPNLPQYEVAEPETAAMSIRSEWSLGARPIRNIVHLLELHGVRVFPLGLDTREVDAFSFWRGKTPFIFLNTMKSAERSRMDAAHELGHLALHSKGNAQRSRKAEQDAQLFGATFLMPHGSMVARLRQGMTLSQILEAKHYWQVSAADLTYRMYHIGLLTKFHYSRMFRELGRRGYLAGEPDGIPRETSQVLSKVFERLRTRGITTAGVASQLAIYPSELGKMLHGLVNFPVVV